MKKSKKAAPKVGAEVLVNVILDRSGSMQVRRDPTISGYNEYIKGLRGDADTKYNVSLTQFDLTGASPALTVSYLDKPLADVPDLDHATYEPRGNTPLYDAIGETIRRVTANGRAVITVIITDGEENASTEFDKDKIKALIAEKEKEGWTFVFLGCDIDAYAAGGAMGIAVGATAGYAPSAAGTNAMFSNAVAATMTRSTAYRSHGLCANTMDFFDDSQKADMLNPGVPKNVPPKHQTAPVRPGSTASGPKQRRNWTTTANK